MLILTCVSCDEDNDECSECNGDGFSNGHLCNYCRGEGSQSYGDNFWKGKEYKYPGN